MPIKNGKVATREDVLRALAEHQSASFRLNLRIVLPSAKPDHKEYLGREHRAYISLIQDEQTEKILLTASSTYALVEKIKNGWKYEPDKKEGLWNLKP